MEVLHTFGVGSARHRSGLSVIEDGKEFQRNPAFDIPIGACVARWDFTESKVVKFRQIHEDLVTCLLRSSRGLIASCSYSAWSADGMRFAVCSQLDDCALNVISVGEDGIPHPMYALPGRFHFVEWTKQGHLFAVAQSERAKEPSYSVRLDPTQHKSTVTWSPLADARVSMCTSNGHGLAAIAFSNNTLHVVDLDSMTTLKQYALRNSAIQTMLFDGDVITVPLPGGRFAIYHLDQDEPVLTESVPGVVYCMQWDGDAHDRLWVCTEGGLFLLDMRGRHPLACAPLDTAVPSTHVVHSVQFHAITCCGVALSPDGRTVVAGDFGANLFAWRVADCRRPAGREVTDQQESRWGHQSQPIEQAVLAASVRSVAWAPSGRFVAAGTETGLLYLWDLKNAPRQVNVSFGKGSCTCLRWNHAGTALAVSTSRGKLVVLGIDDAGTATVQMQLQAHTAVRGGEDSLKHYAEIWSIAWAPDDTRICTVSEDRVARVWTAAGAFVTELTGHSMAVTCVDWQRTQAGEILATCSDDRTVRLWDPASWRLIHTLVSDIPEWHTLTYMSLESGGDRIACSTQHGWICVWSLRTFEKVVARRLHAGSVEGLAWNAGAGLIASCSSDCTVSVVALSSSLSPSRAS